jgi:hypothetical protein
MAPSVARRDHARARLLEDRIQWLLAPLQHAHVIPRHVHDVLAARRHVHDSEAVRRQRGSHGSDDV